MIHVAPKLLGSGPTLVSDLGIPSIGGALAFDVTDVTRLGGDVELRLRPTRHTGSEQPADRRS